MKQTKSVQLSPLECLRPPKLDKLNQEDLRAYFINSWELYEWLFSSINHPGALYVSPDPLRHPLLFYLGHTAVFYLNKMILTGLLTEGIHPGFEQLFAVGVDPAKAADLDARDLWPTEEAVRAYRLQAFEKILEVIDSKPLEGKVDENHPFWAVLMGLEHDRIHFETSSVLIRQYPVDWVQVPEGWKYAPLSHDAPDNEFIPVKGGKVLLGKNRDFPTFGWDNEYEEFEVETADFKAGKYLVTNAEFLQFVHGKGYDRKEYWTEEGWNWKVQSGSKHPKFWIKEGSGFRYRAMFDQVELPLAWPAEVTQHEATAYCCWKGEGNRLLTEAEYGRLVQPLLSEDEDVLFCRDFNNHLRFGSPCAVGSLPSALTANGFADLYGNVWCWLGDDFYPPPGYRVHPLYEDYSKPFIDDQHTLLKGGSWATCGTATSQYYRQWFRRGFLQHAGFRVARDL